MGFCGCSCLFLSFFFKLGGEHPDLTASLKFADANKNEKSPDHSGLFFVFNTTI